MRLKRLKTTLPAIILLHSLANAGGNPSSIQIDTAVAEDASLLPGALAQIKQCKPVFLAIAYGFGEVNISIHLRGQTCLYQVALRGELQEADQPNIYICDRRSISSIDWLFKNKTRRESPPFDSVKQACGFDMEG